MKPFTISLFFLLLILFCGSCEENQGLENVPMIQTPKEVSIDVNGDEEFDFKTSIRKTVGDGPGYTSYGTYLMIEPVNDSVHSLLRGFDFEIFLQVGATITTEDSADYFWSNDGISYASKLQESTNNFKTPRLWTLYIDGEETSGIVAYQLVDDQPVPLMGWIKFDINILNGSIEITEISEPVRANEITIQ